MTNEEASARLREWLASPKGQAKMKEAAEKAAADRERLRRSVFVPPELLRKPLTI